jgi:glycine/D-amino acid oxidase-like deaminating enzyme
MRHVPASADIVILGAGVMGTSIAFHLARRKAGRIVLMEQQQVAFGGSGRSSALVRMHYSFPPEVRLAAKSLEIFQKWQEIVGTKGDFRKTGFIRIVQQNEMERLRANVAMQRECGINTRIVSRAELQEIEPDWNFDDVEFAAYEPDSGYGDGAGVASDFLMAAREMGVEYFPGVGAEKFLKRNGKVEGVQTKSGTIFSPVVVSAIGPWSVPLFQAIGVDLPVQTEYHQVGFLRNPPRMQQSFCACIDSMINLYYRCETGGLTLVGGFYGPRGLDPDHFPESASQETLLEMAIGLSKRIPMLEEASIFRGVTGLYDVSPDARPLLGETIPGLYVAVGFTGMGFKISPAVGLTMSELILDGKATTVDLHPFRPSRFVEGQPIKGEFEYQDD